jgi:WD40 repeat protein
MLSGSDDKTMKIFNLSDGKFLQSFPGHKNWVREAQFSPDMRLIASASDDKSVRLWDLNTKKEYHSFLDHN